MNAAAFTDATLTRVIRRTIAMPGTCSDSLLAVADALTEAARSAHADGADILHSHADDLRRFARYFADAAPAPAAPALTTQEAARALVREFKPSEGALAAAFHAAAEYSPMHAMLGLLLTAAEVEAGP